MVDAVDGIDRIRYTSPHPKDMREDVVRAHADLEALCEHIHLPLQSGSSRVLKAMRRTYDRRRYLERVALIREHVPDCALTTDIIVGFPGETEAEFEETLSVVEEVGYDSAFTFVFSPRRGTEAADLGGAAPARGQARAHGPARRGGAAASDRARSAVRGADDGGAGRGSLAQGPGPPARADPPQQDGALRAGAGGEPAAGEMIDVEIVSATSTTLAGEARSLAGAR